MDINIKLNTARDAKAREVYSELLNIPIEDITPEDIRDRLIQYMKGDYRTFKYTQAQENIIIEDF